MGIDKNDISEYQNDIPTKERMSSCKKNTIIQHVRNIKTLCMLISFIVIFLIFAKVNGLYVSEHVLDELIAIDDLLYPPPPDNLTVSGMIKRDKRSANCPYQYLLSRNIRFSICKIRNEVVLDIRQFLNNRPTIKGIGISINDFVYLKKVSKIILNNILRLENQ